MKKLWVAGILITALGGGSVSMALAADADAQFRRDFGETFFARWWRAHPDLAIENGYYGTADRLVVPDEQARASELSVLRRRLAQLHRIDPNGLSPSVRADWVLLQKVFEGERWEIAEFRDWQWDPSPTMSPSRSRSC